MFVHRQLFNFLLLSMAQFLMDISEAEMPLQDGVESSSTSVSTKTINFY